jgi:DNA-binding transcriptional LysR family regulator
LAKSRFDLLRTFVAVVESGSFTKASHTVFRSQAAVSMQVKRLEEAIGQPLFVRDTRNLELGQTGKALLPYARRLLRRKPKVSGHKKSRN